jgi:hypothetical protein
MEISRNQLCPCGSGKKYKRCCMGKEKEDEIVRIPITPEMRVPIDFHRKEFEKIMGRPAEGDDPVFWSLMGRDPQEVVDEEADKYLRHGLIDEKIAYGFKKLLYMVLPDKRNKFDQEQLAAWDSVVKEYDDLKNGRLKMKESPAIAIVDRLFGNLDKLEFLYNLILRKYSDNIVEIKLWDTININDYIGFCLTKNLKSIKAIKILFDNNFGEDALNLTRTNFENYLEIVFAKFAPQAASKHLLFINGVSEGTHERQGRTIIDLKTKDKIKTLNNFEKAELNTLYRQEDVEIYKYLYDFLSSFTHPDLRTASNYIDDGLGFLAAGGQMKAESLIFLLFINFLILNEIKDMGIFGTTSEKDIENFVKDLGTNLQQLFEMEPELPMSIKMRINKTMATLLP